MEPVIIVRYGEIALKGKNRRFFEKRLRANLSRALDDLEGWHLWYTHGRIFIEFSRDHVSHEALVLTDSHVHDELMFGLARKALERIQRVFGVVSASPGIRTKLTIEDVNEAAEFAFRDALSRLSSPEPTFKVETRRPNKSFPMQSPDVSRTVGAHILQSVPGVSVDVHHPDITVEVELREQAYVRAAPVDGPGGLPLGVSGRGLVLLSGGIDSPVAAWLAMKRGIEVQAVHFHSFPFTSDRAREKVEDLCRVLGTYAPGTLQLHVVHFTEIQKRLQTEGRPDLLTILMRRSMMRIANQVAHDIGALALVTGESVGQVASQTLESITVTNAAAAFPVLRPVITYDKTEIIEKAREIGTYDISIRPYEDCCALFVPKNPRTRPRVDQVQREEERLELDALETEAATSRTTTAY